MIQITDKSWCEQYSKKHSCRLIFFFHKLFILFGVDNVSPTHIDNHKDNILVLGEGPTNDINESVHTDENQFNNKFSKAKAKICLNFYYNAGSSQFFVNRKKQL